MSTLADLQSCLDTLKVQRDSAVARISYEQSRLLRLRGPCGVAYEFRLGATAQSLRLVVRLQIRMPEMLVREDRDRWLDLKADPTGVLNSCVADRLEADPVDKRDGNVRNNDPGLIEPI